MSRNPVGLHSLLLGQLYLYIQLLVIVQNAQAGCDMSVVSKVASFFHTMPYFNISSV
jgi:hypothetical protein